MELPAVTKLKKKKEISAHLDGWMVHNTSYHPFRQHKHASTCYARQWETNIFEVFFAFFFLFVSSRRLNGSRGEIQYSGRSKTSK